MDTKVCNSCKLSKPLDEFGNNKSKADKKQPYCKACGSLRDKKHYEENASRRDQVKESRQGCKSRNREFVLAYLLEHPCIDCGEKNPMFLDFDHVRGKKAMSVSSASRHGWSMVSLKKEIGKCEVRCLKCHRIKTAKEQGWFKMYEAYM